MIKDKANFYWNCFEKPKRIIWYYFNYKLLRRSNPIIIQKQANKYRNQLMFDPPFRIIKLLGWTDQYKDDLYWVIQVNDYKESSIVLHSCVGGFIPLKGKLSGFDYYRAEENWEINMKHCDIEAELKQRKINLK